MLFLLLFLLSRRQGRGRGDERAFLSRGKVPLVGAVGGWPVGSPRGFALPLCARGLIAQRAAALVSAATLVSAARGGRLEGGREREVGGELHRAGILRAAVAPLVEGEAGLRGGLDGLRTALVEGAAARDATLALVGRADRQRVLLR